MLTIENADLRVVIDPKGAELLSVFHKQHGLEYLWNGDPVFWGKHSPILFPIVGTLKEGLFRYQGRSYTLGRHGFGRDSLFEMETQDAESICFLLRSSPASKLNFPFDFECRISYQLSEQTLKTGYSVRNPATAGIDSSEDLYFSIGGHPAFACPLVPGTDYADYWLGFEKKETAPRWPISKDGLIEEQPQPLLKDSDRLPLSKDLFVSDALVFKHLASAAVTLRSAKTAHGLRMDFPGFPFLGLWAAKNADFVCIEPWCGIADSVGSDQQLTQKEGIIRLAPGEQFDRAWTLTVF
jgi:galactose mutarotase-like enzyme